MINGRVEANKHWPTTNLSSNRALQLWTIVFYMYMINIRQEHRARSIIIVQESRRVLDYVCSFSWEMRTRGRCFHSVFYDIRTDLETEPSTKSAATRLIERSDFFLFNRCVQVSQVVLYINILPLKLGDRKRVAYNKLSLKIVVRRWLRERNLQSRRFRGYRCNST